MDLKEAVDIALQTGSNVIRVMLKPLENKPQKKPFKIILTEEATQILEDPNESSEQLSINNSDTTNNIENQQNIYISSEMSSNLEDKKGEDLSSVDIPLGRGINKLTNEFIYLTRKYSVENLNIPIDEVRNRISILLDELYGSSCERHFRSNIANDCFKSFQRKYMTSTSSNSSICLLPYKSKFISDITLPAESKVVRNSKLKKVWKVVNNGTEPWPPGVKLSFIAGDHIPFEPLTPIEKEVKPDESVDIELKFTVPEKIGRYISHFKLTTPDDEYFGQRIFLDIVSVESDTISNTNAPIENESEIYEEIPEVIDTGPNESKDIEVVQATQNEDSIPVESDDSIYMENLQKLSDMGFENLEYCLELLKLRNNELDTVINELLQQLE